MSSKPSVLLFGGEEFDARAVAETAVDEYKPDVREIRRFQVKARQKVAVSGLSNDGRFLVRLPSAPLRVLMPIGNVRITAPNAADCIRHHAELLNQDPKPILARISS